ncbi:MAG: type II secretion system protein GspN [Geobacter sp.]|nr:MAG: type II secretion system protein GspN [Geobacter sp.]
MNLRRFVLIAVSVIGAIFVFLLLTLCFIPDRELQSFAMRLLRQEGYSFRCAEFGKAFPLGVKATDLQITNDRGPLLTARECVIRLRVLPLLAGKVSFTGQAAIGGGHLLANYSLRTGEAGVEARGIHLEDLPFIHTITGATVKGVARVHGRLKLKGKNSGGDMQLEVKGANVAGVKIGGIPLPDAEYPTAQASLRGGGGIISLTSFTLEGAGIYARLKGDMPLSQPLQNAPLNLTLEMMPKPEFLESQKFVFLLLAKYMTSPGHYQIPIRGTLSRPALS